MVPGAEASIRAIIDETIRLHERAKSGCVMATAQAASAMTDSLHRGGKVLIFGNGGSASDAQHVAAEFVGRFVRERKAAPAIALSTDTSILTAVGNDYGFDRVFARQVEALGRPGDVAIGISTSGGSVNVVAGLETARRQGLVTVALTGRDGGAVGRAADIHVNVSSQDTARVQEVHRTLLHAICELVDRELGT